MSSCNVFLLLSFALHLFGVLLSLLLWTSTKRDAVLDNQINVVSNVWHVNEINGGTDVCR